VALSTWLMPILAITLLALSTRDLLKGGISANQRKIDNLVDDCLFQRDESASTNTQRLIGPATHELLIS